MAQEVDERKPGAVARIRDYEEIVGVAAIEELVTLAEKLNGKTIQNINSTFSGGGVAEILMRLVPLMNQLGVDARWDIIRGSEPFFEVTKKYRKELG